MGLRFYTKSFLMMDQIGEREEMIGTNTPIMSPPTTAPNVGVTL
jgi:hypothetical protein